jgi:hypothetical protein
VVLPTEPHHPERTSRHLLLSLVAAFPFVQDDLLYHQYTVDVGPKYWKPVRSEARMRFGDWIDVESMRTTRKEGSDDEEGRFGRRKGA